MSYEEEKQDRKIEQLEIKIEWLQNANTNFVRRICDQTREIERLRAIIDTPPEESEWISDLKVIDRSAGSGLIDIEIAKKWHTAYRKAQNSNLLRKQEIERMRGEMENYGDDYVCQMNDLRSRAQTAEARIQKLDALLNEADQCRRSLLDQVMKVANQRDKAEVRIQELEEALVEYQRLGKTIAGKVPCLTLHGDCGRCSAKMREVCGALEQIGGKIGPEDAKPREGLYGKYRISKADGSPVDPNADYFVLRLDTDPVARRAALEYSYMTPDRNLAIGLQERIAKHNPKMTDCINLQFFGLEHPRVWQITDERKAAICAAINALKENEDPDDELVVIRAILNGTDGPAVLRAMLEAGQ